MTHDRQAGFVLTELLVVMVVSTLLLGATLFTFERFIVNSNESDRANDSAEVARATLEIEARQLRNLAKRVNNVGVIGRVQGDDFIFQTSDPTRTWVRYCLDVSKGVSNGRIWEQTQSGDVAGTGAACPATSGWSTSKVVADSIVNRYAGRTLPLFTYRCVDGTIKCTSALSTSDQIIGVNAQLLVDTTPGRDPEELQVNSGVYLRNQNQAPVASFTSTGVSGQSRTIQLNASSSTDFEGRTLQFFWFLGTMPSAIDCTKPKETVSGTSVSLWGGSFMGRGVVLRYTWPGVTPPAGTAQTIGLVACDPGDRYGYVTQSVQIPS
jgi:type II secretory pathway pseudopilin PulG